MQDKKRLEAVALTKEILSSHVCRKKRLQQHGGKINFFAGLVQELRPSLAGVWAAIADVDKQAARAGNEVAALKSPGTERRARKRLATQLIGTKRITHGLLWTLAFLEGVIGTLLAPSPSGGLQGARCESSWTPHPGASWRC